MAARLVQIAFATGTFARSIPVPVFRCTATRARSFGTGSREISLRGVFVPLVTTFTDDGEQNICYSSMKRNLEIYEKTRIAGYVVGGSNGESPYLGPSEKIDLVRFVRENTDPSRPVIAGSTAESTTACCELTRAVARAGADAVLVMPPFYFRRRMTEEALTGHYLTVAERGGLPIVIYNMPVVSGIDMSTELLAALASHPNIRAVKDSDVRKCANTVHATSAHNFDVLIGSAGYLLPALINGCSGGINGLAGALPEDVATVYHLYEDKELDEATRLQRRLCRPDSLLLAQLGVPGLKYAMDVLGLSGGICRRPIQPLSHADKREVEDCLASASFLSGRQKRVQ